MADAFEDKAQDAAKTAPRSKYADRVDMPDDRVFVGLDAYQKAIDCGPDMIVTATPARLPPAGLRRRHQGRQARLHGKALLRRRRRLPHAHGGQQAGRREGPEGGRRLPAPPHARATSRPSSGSTTAPSASSCSSAPTGTAAASGTATASRSMTEMQYQVNNWYHFCWLSGDNICEQHIHNLDVCNWAKGDHPVEANGMGGCTVRYLGDEQGHGPDLRPPLRRVHLRRRHEDVQPVPPHAQHLEQRVARPPTAPRASRTAPARSRARTRGSSTAATQGAARASRHRWSRSTRT